MGILQDVTETVNINKGEYTRLIRMEQKMEIIRMLLCDVCTSTDTIRKILDIEPIIYNRKPESEE